MKRLRSHSPSPAKGAGKTPDRNSRKASWPRRLLVFLIELFFAVHIAYIALTSLAIFIYKFTDPVYTILMPYRSIGYGWDIQKPRPVKLESIPPYIRSMLVAVEDGKFYEHHGIDMEAFKRAQEINSRLGKPLYGGSTLTMQVARTLFLVPEKSYVRKYFEVIAALELELILSKERILELYFGYAEWGKGIFGIEAAAQHYYGVSTRSLSRDQAARLIALLSSPIKYTPSSLNKSAILRERYAYLTRRFVSPYAVSPDQSSLPESPPGPVEPGFDEAFVETEDAVNAGVGAETDAAAIPPGVDIMTESGDLSLAPPGSAAEAPAQEPAPVTSPAEGTIMSPAAEPEPGLQATTTTTTTTIANPF
jgi:monofunctional biosynthetic peptidoglycan transglycosylase